MNEPPMPNTPLDYVSAQPYFVAFEWNGAIMPFGAVTLDLAVQIFYDPIRPFGVAKSCDRRVLVDGRGVVIHGFTEAVVVPKHVITGEVADVIRRLHPEVAGQVFDVELEMLWQQS